ncbi:MAG: VPLPA-CTERM sorting domain-containing protein [Bacteroidota bacterium]
MKRIRGIILGMVLLAGMFLLSAVPAGAALYSGAWTPTSSSVEYFNITFTDSNADNDFKFFVYNKNTGEELTIFNTSQFLNSKTIDFSSDNGNHMATLGSNVLNLGVKPHFWLGFDLGAGSVYEYSYSLLTGDDQFQINLGDKVLISSDASPVPLPASVWLLGSALMGLAGFGRRFMNLS